MMNRLRGNTAIAANNAGGGIGNAGNGAVSMTDSTISDNFSGGVGGGFGDQNGQGTLSLLNTTFVGNAAIGAGGGIFEGGSSTTINDRTITGNSTQATGGGIDVPAGNFTLNNTVVAGNLSNDGTMNFAGDTAGGSPDVSGTLASGSGNFIGLGDAGLMGIGNAITATRSARPARRSIPCWGRCRIMAARRRPRCPRPGAA